MLHRARSFLRNLFAREAAERRLDGEMQGFLEMLAAEHRARGVADDEAWRLARLEAGGSTQVKEAVRDVRAGAWLEMLARDIRLAARRLARSPAFTVTTTATLALGLGATVAVLAIADAVLLRPLGYADADRLVTVLQHGTDPVAPANYLDWKAAATGTLELEAAEYWTPTLSDGDAEKVDGLHVTPGMMRLLGVTPALGPGFTQGAGDDRELIISDALWRRRYGADPGIIGHSIVANGTPHVVVGVMPRGFQFAPFWATGAQLWAPLSLAGLTSDRERSSLRLFGRLAPSVDLARAQVALDLVTRRLAASFPESNKDIRVVSLKEKTIGNARPALYALAGAVAFVLLIMWVNVAHMLVARAYARDRELKLRVALGASRQRLLRETLIESAILATAGGAMAAGLTSLALDLVTSRGPFDLPQLTTLSLDGRVLGLAAILVGVTAIIITLLPASLANGAVAAPTLRHDSRGATSGVSRARVRQMLMASEMAFAVVLLVGTLLMVRTFSSMRAIDPGFDANGLVTMQVPVPAGVTSAGQTLTYFNGMAERLRATPGVSGAGFINHLPLAGDEWGAPTFGGVNENGGPGDAIRSVYRVITPGLLSTMRIAVEEGRDVSATDELGRPSVILVNRQLAKRLWPNASAVGQRVTFAPAGGDRSWFTVVGVTENVKQSQWTAESGEEVYLPYAQSRSYLEEAEGPRGYLTLVVRTSQDPASVVRSVRAIAAAADPTRPVTDVATMDEVVDRMTARSRFLMSVLIAFAVLAVAVAAVGVFGVMSYAVAQRRQEIGIRVALGADGWSITGIVLGQAALVASIGIATGCAAALGLTQFIAGQLYGVAPRDPASFALAIAVLVVTGAIATAGPLLRARRIDPLSAIRND